MVVAGQPVTRVALTPVGAGEVDTAVHAVVGLETLVPVCRSQARMRAVRIHTCTHTPTHICTSYSHTVTHTVCSLSHLHTLTQLPFVFFPFGFTIIYIGYYTGLTQGSDVFCQVCRTRQNTKSKNICVTSLYICTPKTHICTRYLARCAKYINGT